VGGPPGMLVGAAVGAVVIGGGIVIYNNREAVGDAIEKSMEMRGEAELLNAQSQMDSGEIPMVLFPACLEMMIHQKRIQMSGRI
ncbi:hypothetical protein ECC1470_04918, partial [Escherichia coli ECC-1470]